LHSNFRKGKQKTLNCSIGLRSQLLTGYLLFATRVMALQVFQTKLHFATVNTTLSMFTSFISKKTKQLVCLQNATPSLSSRQFNQGHRNNCMALSHNDKAHVNIGTIGHHNHGKTTLTGAITQVLAQRNLAEPKELQFLDHLPEEKKKGATIDLNFVQYETEARHYVHVDVPGHTDYMKNTIRGAARLDGAVLVVSCVEGSMEQTREHLLIVKHLGVQKIVVFLNKVDEADEEMIELVEMEVRELLTELGFDGDNSPVVKGSALKAYQQEDSELGEDKINELLNAVDQHIDKPLRDIENPFLLAIDKCYSIPGRGTFVSGCVERGVLKKGEVCEILGFDKQFKVNVSGLETFKTALDRVQAGDHADIQVKGVKMDDIRLGKTLVKAGTANMVKSFEGETYLFPKNKKQQTSKVGLPTQPMCYCNKWAQPVRLEVPGGDSSVPSGARLVYHLPKKMVVVENQPFILRDQGDTIGYGFISQTIPGSDQSDKE